MGKLEQQARTEITCGVCLKTIKWKHQWSHKQTHMEARCRCEKCDKAFRTKMSLESHLVRIHEMKDRSVRCPYENCKRPMFAFKSQLNFHINLVHKWQEVECGGCGFKFRSETYLKLHLQRGNCKGKKKRSADFKCPDPSCQKRYFYKSTLLTHISSLHVLDGYKGAQKCDKCGASFDLPSDLQEHIASKHDGIFCNVCNQKFASCKGLKLHTKKVHPFQK